MHREGALVAVLYWDAVTDTPYTSAGRVLAFVCDDMDGDLYTIRDQSGFQAEFTPQHGYAMPTA